MNDTVLTMLSATVYIVIMLVIGSLAHQMGYYKGMQAMCGGGTPGITSDGLYVCYIEGIPYNINLDRIGEDKSDFNQTQFHLHDFR